MNFDFARLIMTRKRQPMLDADGVTQISFGSAALFAIDSAQAKDGPEKYRRFRIGVEIQQSLDDGKPLDMKTDELELLDKIVSEVLPPHIYGQFHDAVQEAKRPPAKPKAVSN